MRWALRLRHHLRAALISLPLEAIAVAVAVVSFWGTVTAPSGDLAQRCFFSSVLAAPLFFSVTLARRAGRLSGWPAHALSILATLSAIAIGATPSATEEAFAWRFGLALLAAVMIPFAAVAGSSPRGDRLTRFADFVRRFSEETTSSGLLWAAATAATAVLFISVEELFELPSMERPAVHSLAAVTGLCVLAYLHRLLPGNSSGRVPELWRRLIARVAAPFLVAMLAILSIYEVWVLARGALPVNMISPLIIAAGALGFASTLVIESLVAVREQRTLTPAEPHPWATAGSVRLARAFTAVLLALLPLAGWALWVRIEQHGLTPSRGARMYALTCLGVLALWGAIRWLRRRRPLSWEVPVCTAITALVAAVGPLSVVSLSLRSQTDRLERALAGAGVASRVVETTPPPRPIQISGDAYAEISSRVDMLVELGGPAALGPMLTGDLAQCEEAWSSYRCLTHLGIASPGALHAARDIVHLTRVDGESAAGFHLVDIDLGSSVTHPVLGRLRLTDQGDRLILERDGSEWASADVPLDRWVATGAIGAVPALRAPGGCILAHATARSAVLERTPDGPRFDRLFLLLLVPIEPTCPPPG